MTTDTTTPISDVEAAGTRGIGPSWLSGLLLGLATLLAVISVFSTWVKTQALETDTWVELTDDLLDEPEIQAALAAYLVDELYARVDVSAGIAELLPGDLSGLAGPVTGALRGPATDAVERLIASDAFGEAWSAANRNAHEVAVAILRDETPPGVSTAEGVVELELGVLILLVGERLGLPDGVLDRLPDDAGRITVFESEELESAQTGVSVLDFLSWFLFLVVVALYAGAVAVTEDRVRALRNVGVSLIGAGVFVVLLRALTVRGVVGAVVEDDSVRPLAEVTGYVATRLIREMAWTGIAWGAVIALFAALLGGRRWAVATRRALAPALNASRAAVAGGTLLLILLLLWWSPGRSFERWVSGLTLVALVVIAVVALRRTTMRDHPDATFDELVVVIRGRVRDDGTPQAAD